MEDLKDIVSKNIIKYRKLSGLTQGELAEKLSYSDKAVSKWERSESLPDIVVLKQIADIFEISVDALLSSEQPKNQEQHLPLIKQKHFLITILSIGIVWVVATICFAFLGMIIPSFKQVWLSFIYAIPASFIVSIVFSFLWGKNWQQALSISGLIWSLAIALFLTFKSINWLIFIIPVPVEILIIIFFSCKDKFFSKNKNN